MLPPLLVVAGLIYFGLTWVIQIPLMVGYAFLAVNVLTAAALAVNFYRGRTSFSSFTGELLHHDSPLFGYNLQRSWAGNEWWNFHTPDNTHLFGGNSKNHDLTASHISDLLVGEPFKNVLLANEILEIIMGGQPRNALTPAFLAEEACRKEAKAYFNLTTNGKSVKIFEVAHIKGTHHFYLVLNCTYDTTVSQERFYYWWSLRDGDPFGYQGSLFPSVPVGEFFAKSGFTEDEGEAISRAYEAEVQQLTAALKTPFEAYAKSAGHGLQSFWLRLKATLEARRVCRSYRG